MLNLTKPQQAMLQLISAGCLKKDIYVQLSAQEWSEVFAISSQQALLGVVFEGVAMLDASLRPSISLYMQWGAYVAKIESANKLIGTKTTELLHWFKKENIPCAVLKGQGIARNYPLSNRRQCGDIDLYVGADNFDASNALMLSLGAEATGLEMMRHQAWNWQGIEVEIHKYPAIMSSPSHNKYLKGLTNQWFPNNIQSITTANGCVLPVPTIEYDACYILEHAIHHIFDGGVGLRQILDWLLHLNAHREVLDKEKLAYDLKSLGLYKVACAIAIFGRKYLGFDDLPIASETADERLLELIMTDVLDGGNFGHHSEVGKNKPKEEGWDKMRYSFYYRTLRLKKFFKINPKEAIWFNIFIITNFIYKLRKK